MEDRFLFRAKCLHDNKWTIGSLFICRKTNGSFISSSDSEFLGDIKEIDFRSCEVIHDDVVDQWVEVDQKTIGQCTGRKDKNGKLIFEGDRVKVWNGNKTYIWFDKGFWRIGKEGRLVLEGEFCELEVVGNIHEEE